MILVERGLIEGWLSALTGEERSIELVAGQMKSILCSEAPIQGAQSLTFGYTNYRGDYAVRSVIPHNIYFGSTEWHREPQWLLRALDVEKQALRDFALKDMGLK